MRMTLLVACISFAFGSAALAQSVRFPVTAPPPVSVARVNPAASGTAQGYIFWAKNDFKYNDQTVCQDLTVSVGAGGGGGTDNPTTYVTAGPYAGCAYSVGGLLEHAEVKIHIKWWPTQLTPSGYGIVFSPADSYKPQVELPGHMNSGIGGSAVEHAGGIFGGMLGGVSRW